MNFPAISASIMEFSWWYVAAAVGIWGGTMAGFVYTFWGAKEQRRFEAARKAKHVATVEGRTRGVEAERDGAIELARLMRAEAEAGAAKAMSAVDARAAQSAAARAIIAAEKSRDAATAASNSARALLPHPAKVKMDLAGKKVVTEADAHAAAAAAAAERAGQAAAAKAA